MKSIFPLCLSGSLGGILFWGSLLPVQAQGITPLFPETFRTPSPVEPLPPSQDIPTLPIVPDPRPVPPTPAPRRPLPRGSFEEISRYFRDLNRAKNLARQAAEIANGGLQRYRAEASMHGAAIDAPFEEFEDAWVFTFRGGEPGFVQPSIETQVRVDRRTFQTTILYNGPIRSRR
ncbi:hypothetical protein [Synechococcus sp. W70.1]|jgi:hypothetical protein|uniref:hypothetical protein n=1 Tax=unclassified Synechococcus TaxID=2626047 RepID=UPI0039C23E87